MGIGNLQMFTALTQKMQWHQVRQGVLSENVANAETPGYRGKDLRQFAFDAKTGPGVAGQLQAATTSKAHFGVLSQGPSGFSVSASQGFEMTPEGNSVGLEDEMMKVAQNQMDYMAATSLYTRSMRILKTALGRNA